MASFIMNFFKNYKEVGSVCPSSPLLIKKMIAGIDFSKAQTVVELGAGEGCITRHLLKNLRSDAKLVVFETNKNFYKTLLEISDPRISVLNESAEDIDKFLHGNKADYIVSSLPLTLMDENKRFSILKNAAVSLSAEGSYIQYQYSPLVSKLIRSVFPKVKKSLALINLPPAVVYRCSL